MLLSHSEIDYNRVDVAGVGSHWLIRNGEDRDENVDIDVGEVKTEMKMLILMLVMTELRVRKL